MGTSLMAAAGSAFPESGAILPHLSPAARRPSQKVEATSPAHKPLTRVRRLLVRK